MNRNPNSTEKPDSGIPSIPVLMIERMMDMDPENPIPGDFMDRLRSRFPDKSPQQLDAYARGYVRGIRRLAAGFAQ